MGKKKSIGKSVLILGLLGMMITSLTGCGLGGEMISSASAGDGMYRSSGLAYDDNSIEVVNDYVPVTVDEPQADYSYEVMASGDTHRSSEDISKDFDAISEFVKECGGFMEEVDGGSYINSWSTDYAKETSFNFTVEVPPENAVKVVDFIKSIAAENNMELYRYRQYIYTYGDWYVEENEEDEDYGDYEYEYSDESRKIINETDLERRLKWTDIHVSLSYNTPYPFVIKCIHWLDSVFSEFWDVAGGIVLTALGIAICLLVVFVEFLIFYCIFKKFVYKRRLKKPEQYPARHVVLDAVLDPKVEILDDNAETKVSDEDVSSSEQ